METPSIDTLIFAPLAPILCVLLLWFIQLLFIESEKYLLEKIRPLHEPLFRFTNFLGILFQNICHALGYTVTKSGISDFHITIHYGQVKPKREKKGIFEWTSNAFLFIGPFFFPAFLLLLCLFILIEGSFSFSIPGYAAGLEHTFGGQIITMGTNLYDFSAKFLGFLANIDLLHPGHFGFFIFMIILGMGIRPLYIGEKKTQKVDMFYDLRNIWNLIRNNPKYLIFLFILSYIFFYFSYFLNQHWYVYLFSIFGWLSIISIISIFISNLILALIMKADEIKGLKKILPFFLIPVGYCLMRFLFYFYPVEYKYSLSLLITFLTTFLVTWLLLKKSTNSFKSKLGFKLFKKKKGEK